MSASPACPRCRAPLPEAPADGYCPFCGAPCDTQLPAPPDETRTLLPHAALTPAFPGAVTPTAGPPHAQPEGNGWRSPPHIPNYRNLTYIAGGGMGVVFRAVQSGVERTVAIKLINRAGVSDPAIRARFGNEMQALGRVKHAGVVQVYDTGETDDTPFFTMEFVGGGTLGQRLGRLNGVMPADEAARIMAAVAEAVHAAHEEKILHRDLKPGNVLMTEDGTPKVADFGLAKFLDSAFRITVSRSQLGTPPYMAPEQIRGELTDITERTDVYGLGATLYECLTGRPPFRGATPQQTTQLVLDTDPAPPSKVRPGVPQELEAVCLKCLAKDPARRFATARELADELRRWLAGVPTLTQPPTRLQRAGRWAKRHRAKLAAVGLVLFTALGVAAAVWRSDPKRQTERTLDRGDPVTLIGETGNPRWHRWVIGEVALAESNVGDRSCGFQTQALSVLELCPDPRHDTYRFSVEIKHLHAPDQKSAAGVWVGCPVEPEADGIRALRFIGVQFHDFKRPVDDLPGVVPSVYADDRVVLRSSDSQPSNYNYGAFPFTPANRSVSPPNPWRRIDLDVSPDGIDVFWERDGKMVRSHRVTRAAMNQRELDFQTEFRASRPGPPIPAWAPRSPLGVYASNADIAFRKAVLTPIFPTP